MRIRLLFILQHMKRFAISLSVFFQVFFFSSLPVFAADDPTSLLTGGLNDAAAGAGYNQSLSLPDIIGRLIAAVLGAVGIILVIRVIQAGILYMTANGEPAKTATAKKMISEAIVGIIIIIAAYALTDFVITQLAGAID
jgi:hypothetical protein